MSQAGIINVAGGGGGGSPIQTLTGDDGVAVPPTANNIFLVGGTSPANNLNGIRTVGNAGTSTESVQLTNRVVNAVPVTTTGAVSATLLTLNLSATPGVYTFDITVAGFAKTGTGSPLGAGFTIVGAVRSTGGAAVLIPTQVVDHFEEGAMSGASAVLATSGNQAIVTVTGVTDGGAGFVIDWQGTLNYTFAS